MLATTTLPAWLGFSTLAWVVTGVVAAAIAVAFLALVRGRDVFAKALVAVLAIGVAATGFWYRTSMTESRRSCSTTLFSAQVRTPGCPIH
jgi:hypothetical protein